jgi:lipopolysaccharide transport protein LptA
MALAVALAGTAVAADGPGDGLTGGEGSAATAGKGTVLTTPGGGRVVINAKSVLYDFGKRVAQFENQVSVTDAQVMLTAERMDVYLTEENAVHRVEAIGDVVIRELGTAKKATAGRGVYDMAADTVVLTDDPYLEDRDQGFFTRGAERIVYDRAKQQFKAEGENVQIEFGVKSDGAHSPTELFRPREGAKSKDGTGSQTTERQEKTAP